MNKLQNDKVYISLSLTSQEITGGDLTDMNNLPKFYTKGKRNLQKAWNDLEKQFNPNMNMYQVINILDAYGLKPHSYCAMD